MNRTKWLQETRLMRFKDTHQDWLKGRLTQEEAARLLGVSDRTFRRYMARYEEDGVDGLLDKRLSTASHRRAPLDEVLDLEKLYGSRYQGWNVKHFYRFYQMMHTGGRSDTWVKNTLQKAGLVTKAKGRGKHRSGVLERVSDITEK